MTPEKNAAILEGQLNNPDRARRLHALRELKSMVAGGLVKREPERPWVNMHCHTFYSYNTHGWSPSRVAWEMYRRGLAAAGIIDFDVLDGTDEALAAGDALLMRFTSGIESRVFVKEFEKDVLNSPNEPGIAYYCGQGFATRPSESSTPGRTLRKLGDGIKNRNKVIVDRVNAYLGDVTIEYEKDVLPLTPSGNATERHILEAYINKAETQLVDAAQKTRFWSAKLQSGSAETATLLNEPVRFRDTMRKKLMKYGGPGYVTPDPRNFPALDEMVAMVRDCGAMPMYAWLDGTTDGERDTELLLEFFTSAGQAGINIIPDRNWNLHNPAEKTAKVANLDRVVTAARQRNLVISVGTEMNNAVQPIVDHFDAPEMKAHGQAFLEGALIIWGHSLLLRHGGFGYLSPQAQDAFGNDVAKKNAFFLEVGIKPPPHGGQLQALREASKAGSRKGVLQALSV